MFCSECVLPCVCVFLPAETGISAAGPDGCTETEVSRTPSPQQPGSALDAPEVHAKANLYGIKWSSSDISELRQV